MEERVWRLAAISIPDHVIQRCDSCQMVIAKYTLLSCPKLGRQIDAGAHLYRAYMTANACPSGQRSGLPTGSENFLEIDGFA